MDIKALYEKFRSGVTINESAEADLQPAPAPERSSIEEAIHLMSSGNQSSGRITESADIGFEKQSYKNFDSEQINEDSAFGKKDKFNKGKVNPYKDKEQLDAKNDLDVDATLTYKGMIINKFSDGSVFVDDSDTDDAYSLYIKGGTVGLGSWGRRGELVDSESGQIYKSENAEFDSVESAKKAIDRFKNLNESVRNRAAKKVMESNFGRKSKVPRGKVDPSKDTKQLDEKNSLEVEDQIMYKGMMISTFNDGKCAVYSGDLEGDANVLYIKGGTVGLGSWGRRGELIDVVSGNIYKSENSEFDSVEDAKKAIDRYEKLNKTKDVTESAIDDKFKENKRVRPKNLNESAFGKKDRIKRGKVNPANDSEQLDAKNNLKNDGTIKYKGMVINTFDDGSVFVDSSDSPDAHSLYVKGGTVGLGYWGRHGELIDDVSHSVYKSENAEFDSVESAKKAIDRFKNLNESAKKVPSKRPRLLEAEDTEEETDFSIEDAVLIDGSLVLTVEKGNGEAVTLTLKNVDLDQGDTVYDVAPEEDEQPEGEEGEDGEEAGEFTAEEPEIEESAKK